MANKFLGLDSINVLTSYIDQAVTKKTENSLVLTIQAYKYFTFDETPATPIGGGFDFNNGAIVWPEDGWKSLKDILNDIEDLESALADGSIYVSSAVITGKESIYWSRPMRISGQNGVSIKFAYSYNATADVKDRTKVPSGVNATNRVEYVWTKEAEEDWVGPTIWAMYSEDADNVLWRYCVTKELKTPNKPSVGDSTWSKNLIDRNLSKEYPYMWMCSQIVPAGQEEKDGGWSEPILFGHWGMDGNVPDYNVTLYAIGTNLDIEGTQPGMVKPKAPVLSDDPEAVVEKVLYEDFRELNTDWKDLPEDDENIWWQCTVKVNGQTTEIMEIGAVKRYNAVDGQALPGQFTKYLYAWSDKYNVAPELTLGEGAELENGWKPKGWYERPDYDLQEDWKDDVISTLPESSIWMISGIADGYTDGGYPDVAEWSKPIRISGPRGPISYDYRIETRYYLGTSAKPKDLPTDAEWYKTAPQTTSQYPYIWANNYLVCYKMKYGEFDEKTGEYPIEPADNGTVLESYDYFRLTGLDGEDGNRKNSIRYSKEGETITVSSFSGTNLYISNSNADVEYHMALDQLSFIDGYTGKFANIGNGLVRLVSGDQMPFVGSDTTATTLELNSQESVEIVCYNSGKNKQLLVIGKAIPAPTE